MINKILNFFFETKEVKQEKQTKYIPCLYLELEGGNLFIEAEYPFNQEIQILIDEYKNS